MALTYTACVEDDNFDNFRPVDFFIKASRLNIDAGQTITYQDSSKTGVSREWTFDGGVPETSTEQSPEVLYEESGVFDTRVTTTFADGSTERRLLKIEVFPLVVADFSATPAQSLPGSPVQFNNLTQGVGTIPATMPALDSSILYLWVFEGISEDTIYGNNPVVTYDNVGSYDVYLKVIRRATNFVTEVRKEDFIQIVSVPILGPRTVDFDRDGSSILLSMDEALADLPAGIASSFTLTGSDGSSVAITGAEIPAWSGAGNHLKLNFDNSALTAGTDYTLSLPTGSGITFASESILGAVDQTLTFYGSDPDWLDFLYPQMDPNQMLTASANGKTFNSVSQGVLFAWGCNPAVNVLNPSVEGYRCPGTNPSNPASPELSVVFSGSGDASLDDLRDVGFEFSFLGDTGSTLTFSQPVTDLRFHNTFGNMEQIPVATLSADGKTITIESRGARNGGARITAILEGPVSESGVQVGGGAADNMDINAYITATVK